MDARVISHYRLEECLGRGSFGEVFRARDLALGRNVALKVLHAGVAREQRARLAREARLCARLQHPGIATLHEAGESSGRFFIAMELIAGETLRQRLQRGPLEAKAVIELGARLLEALAHAHAAGILHRDVKPENIMVSSDRGAALLDFGLASAVAGPAPSQDQGAATRLTAEGVVVGTIGYASPEQLRGDPLDPRSDLFALAAVLYEALAGVPAFPGASTLQRVAAILSRDPQALPLSVPAGLEAVLRRALRRAPEERYSSAAAFLSDLRRVGAGELPSGLPESLLVLEPLCLGAESESSWVACAVAESVAVDLARLERLQVVSRERLRAESARMEREGVAGEPLTLGQRLGCRWVLSGGLQRSGERLRLSAWLHEVPTGDLVAAEKIDGTVAQIFTLEDELAAWVARALRHQRPTSPVGRPLVDVEVYESFTRARQLTERLDRDSLARAEELFLRALERDPSHARSLSALAALRAIRYTFTTARHELDAAADFARRALAADPELADAHVWLAYALFRLGHHAEAHDAAATALRLEPGNLLAAYFAAVNRAACGQPAIALEHYQTALATDSAFGYAWLGAGMAHAALGRRTEALWCLERAIALESLPGSGPTVGARAYRANLLRDTGELDAARTEALAALEEIERRDHIYRDTARGVGLVSLGWTALAERDARGAGAAFAQARAHLRGRVRTLGGGHLMVQALAGLAATEALEGREPRALRDEAATLLAQRPELDFAWYWGCADVDSRAALARAGCADSAPPTSHDHDGRT